MGNLRLESRPNKIKANYRESERASEREREREGDRQIDRQRQTDMGDMGQTEILLLIIIIIHKFSIALFPTVQKERQRLTETDRQTDRDTDREYILV